MLVSVFNINGVSNDVYFSETSGNIFSFKKKGQLLSLMSSHQNVADPTRTT